MYTYDIRMLNTERPTITASLLKRNALEPSRGRLWSEETALLFEFSVRRGFLEKGKTGMEAVAYVSSTLRNDSFSAVRDRTRAIPFRL